MLAVESTRTVGRMGMMDQTPSWTSSSGANECESVTRDEVVVGREGMMVARTLLNTDAR